ncbi:sugar porter family MFS transporter [Methanococcus maripaludis]|uniref:sugar porter family MFS transporter n=1 Tax=Methanococcus maripaludis TaxID=39152 RepID=UPI00215D5F1E|nr:sugar porter family MFS transporter [Methanococcus maripaludis]
MLLIGRFIQGIASGLASSTITTYVADNAPTSPKWISAAVISGAPWLDFHLVLLVQLSFRNTVLVLYL